VTLKARLEALFIFGEIKVPQGCNQHVVPAPNGWAVRAEGAEHSAFVFSTQSEAIAKGRELAISQRSELFIHGEDGQIRERNTYGHDPRQIKG
jgi:Uncharacterized protein conserved in bacteria (DUF2188)